MIEYISGVDSLFLVSALASLVGLTIYYLYGGFIYENYGKIKWFRRLFLPHVSRLIKYIDGEYEEVDLSMLEKIETDTSETEHVFDLYLFEGESEEDIRRVVGQYLIKNHFRPEVILASLGNNPDGLKEIGNFALTAPDRRRVDVNLFGRVYDILIMFLAESQLHVRIYYDSGQHRLRFYAHKELNPYNPLFAMDHLKAKSLDQEAGVEKFEEYKDDIANYGVEAI